MSAKRKINPKQFLMKGVKFGFIGAIGTVLNLGILYALTDFAHVFYLYSELIAIITVFGFNYVGNILIGNISFDSEAKDGAR